MLLLLEIGLPNSVVRCGSRGEAMSRK